MKSKFRGLFTIGIVLVIMMMVTVCAPPETDDTDSTNDVNVPISGFCCDYG